MDTYPARGRAIEIDFGEDGPFGPFAAQLTFAADADSLSFVVTRGSLEGKAETCDYRATRIGDGVWFVHWREADGLTVVQAQDFNRGTLSSAVTTPDHELVQLDGTLRIL